MLSRIKNYVKKQLEYTREDFVHLAPDNCRWGNTIQFDSEDKTRINGHKTPMVENGDVFGQRMQSGRLAIFRIRNVKPCGDPRDMFFAEVDFMHYLEQVSNG